MAQVVLPDIKATLTCIYDRYIAVREAKVMSSKAATARATVYARTGAREHFALVKAANSLAWKAVRDGVFEKAKEAVAIIDAEAPKLAAIKAEAKTEALPYSESAKERLTFVKAQDAKIDAMLPSIKQLIEG